MNQPVFTLVVARILHHVHDEFPDLAVVLLAAHGFLDGLEDGIELLAVDLCIRAGRGLELLLDELDDDALDHEVVLVADLEEGGAGAVDRDAELDGDLEDLALLDLVDVLVVVGAQLDLVDEALLDVVDRHAGSPTIASPDSAPQWGLRPR